MNQGGLGVRQYLRKYFMLLVHNTQRLTDVLMMIRSLSPCALCVLRGVLSFAASTVKTVAIPGG